MVKQATAMLSGTGGLPPVSARPRGMRVLEVLAVQRIAKHMQRITFGGCEIEGIPEGPNIKLLIPPKGITGIELPELDARGKLLWPDPSRRPAVRTYSVRRFDREKGELDVDFVLHGADGIASSWAETVKPGAEILIGGPGGRTIRRAPYYVIAGDHSALAAMARILEDLPDDTQGRVFIEVTDADDRMALHCPAGLTIEWLVNGGGAHEAASLLPQAVRSGIDWAAHPGCSLWIGAESAAVRDIRAFARDELKLDRKSILAVGYWKRGMREDAYHEAHDNDRDEDYHAAWREERAERAAVHA